MPTLLSPDGQKYTTGDQAEITRLKARGYTVIPDFTAPQKPPKKTSSES